MHATALDAVCVAVKYYGGLHPSMLRPLPLAGHSMLCKIWQQQSVERRS